MTKEKMREIMSAFDEWNKRDMEVTGVDVNTGKQVTVRIDYSTMSNVHSVKEYGYTVDDIANYISEYATDEDAEFMAAHAYEVMDDIVELTGNAVDIHDIIEDALSNLYDEYRKDDDR